MTTSIIKRDRILAVENILALAFAIIMNFLAITLPLNNKTTGELSDEYPNMFTPAGITFSIWSIIYLFLIAFVIYQAIVFFKQKQSVADVRSITPLFIINCMGNGAWLFAWHYQQVALSVAIMLVMLSTLILIHHRLQLARPFKPLATKLLLDVPFSLYLGWISIATIANVTTLFVDLDIVPLGISSTIWTIIMIITGAIIALFMIVKKRNIVFGLVVCWAFYGITLKRLQVGSIGSGDIIMVCHICVGILLAAMVFAFFNLVKRSTSGAQG